MRGLWLISFWGCNIAAVTAQEAKDTSWFKNFELIASKTTGNNPGSVKINLPLNNSGSIADALNQNSALFVKYYGPSGLATTSMRGMGAQHAAVSWNGVNLQSSMNGVLDFNLLPSFFIDKVMIETGANASSANGAIAGAIYLDNNVVRNKTIFTELQLGSFNSKTYAFGFSHYWKKWSFQTRVLHRSAENNYEYVNYFMPGKPMEKISNSRFEQKGMMQELSFKANKQHRFYLNAWYQETKRQLPPPMGASSQHEKQNDFSSRAILNHDYQISTGKSLQNKLAFLSEEINYYNDVLKSAKSHSKTGIAESELRLKFRQKFDFLSTLNYTCQTASTDGYAMGKVRNLLLWRNKLEYRIKNELIRLSIANSEFIANGHRVPSSPDIGFEYRCRKWLSIKGNTACTYRLPTFNDLYWQPGGNTDLKPENGKKAELSLELKIRALKFIASGFYHLVNNWILWLPDSKTGAWRANNARQVESKGVEIASELNRTLFRNHTFHLFGRYQYVESIQAKVYTEDITALNKQLIYTPVHTGFAQFRYGFRNLQFNFGTVFTGSRYTTSDNNLQYKLPGYITANSGLTYTFNYRKQSSSLDFMVNNLSNKTYQVMENRPMPLKNYQITLKININYEKN